MPDQIFVDLRWVFAVLRRWWWLIAGLALLAAVVTFIITSFTPPVYEASAMLLVNPSKNSTASQYNDLMAGTQLALTYSKMIKDRPVLEIVIQELGLKQSPDALAKKITAEPVSSSQIIRVTVKDTDPQQAALIANTLGTAFTKRVEEISVQRYANTIKNAKDRTEELHAQIKDLQTQNNSLRSKKVSTDVTLANKQTSLTTLQSDYRATQTSYQQMQLSVAEITGKVYIVEPVQMQKSTTQAANLASAVISIGQAQSPGGASPDNRLALTYGNLIIKPALLQQVIKELGLTDTNDQLSGKISFELVPGTPLIRFTVQDTDGLKAQLIAQTLIQAYVAQVKAMLAQPYSDQLANLQKQIKDMEVSINSLQSEIGELTSETEQMAADLTQLETELTTARSDYREALQNYEKIQTTAVEASDAVTVTEPANPPKAPSGNKLLFVVVAGFLGMAVGTGAAFFLKYIDGKIRTDQDVRSAINLPVLSSISQLSKEDDELVMGSAPTSNVAEDFRILGNKIHFLSENSAIKTLLITSPVPSEGKSLVVSNLAIGLTRIGLRIVVVDADLRFPRQHNLFKLDQEEGLTSSLNRGKAIGTLQSTNIGELRVLTSGKVPSNPAELLSSPYLVHLFEELKERADIVLIDCPPVLVASDASILASKVDGVLLVLKAGYSESAATHEAIETLQHVKAKVVGVVLNFAQNRKISYSASSRRGMVRLVS